MQAVRRRSPFTLLSLVFLALLVGVSACNKKPSLNLENQGRLDQPPERKEIDASGLVRMAQRLEAAGDYANAMTFYADALSRDAELVDAYLGLARIFDSMGESDQSTNFYGQVYSLDPENVAALRRYALGLIDQDRPRDAAEAVYGHLVGHEGDAALHNILGVSYDLLSNHTGAQDAYRTGMALLTPSDDQFVRLVNNLALSLAISDQYSEAVLLLTPYVGDMRQGMNNMTRHQSLYRQNLAIVYAISGQTEAAVNVAKSAINEADAEFNRNFYETIPVLSGYDRTRAVFLGKLPDPGP